MPSDLNPDIKALGFTSVVDFQTAWNLGPELRADGIDGPVTSRAAETSARRRAARVADISPNFSALQFMCHCGGRLDGCRRTVILRDLLVSLEALTKSIGRRPGIIDGYRCPTHNHAVGGAADSQHLYGSAADVEMNLSVGLLKPLHLFSGIGYKAASRRVTHVDRRDVSGHNSTNGSRDAPTTWTYPG